MHVSIHGDFLLNFNADVGKVEFVVSIDFNVGFKNAALL